MKAVKEEKGEQKVPSNLICKICGSDQVILSGKRNRAGGEIQQYYCKNHKRFILSKDVVSPCNEK